MFTWKDFLSFLINYNSFTCGITKTTCVSLLHLMRAIAHASTRATSLMRVKNSTCHLRLWYSLSAKMQQRKWRTITSNLIVDHFSSTFVKLSLAWILHFYKWFYYKGKFLVRSEYYNEFGKYRPSSVSTILEPREST